MNREKISVAIVDDEPLGRDLLRHMLTAHPEFEITTESADGEKALAAIRRSPPDLLLLDVRMPRLDGVALIEKLPAEKRPLVVFVTAHATYALRAFERHVFDYLLKPFDQERFDATIVRVKNRLDEIDAARLGHSVRELMADSATRAVTRSYLERIVVRESGRVFFVGVAEIRWLEADGNYVALHLENGRTHLVHETMTAMEGMLDPAIFLRIHRSTMVRIDRIKELLPHFNGEYVVILGDGVRLKLSRGFLEKARTVLRLD